MLAVNAHSAGMVCILSGGVGSGHNRIRSNQLSRLTGMRSFVVGEARGA